MTDRRKRSSLLFDLFAANQRVRALLTAAMDGAGLKPDEYAVYSALFEFEPISPTEIAATVGMPPTTLSHYIRAMARQPGRVFTRSQLLDAIHGQALESYERAIDAHVKNIRRKLEPDPRHPHYLLTVYGVGYRVADA